MAGGPRARAPGRICAARRSVARLARRGHECGFWAFLWLSLASGQPRTLGYAAERHGTPRYARALRASRLSFCQQENHAGRRLLAAATNAGFGHSFGFPSPLGSDGLPRTLGYAAVRRSARGGHPPGGPPHPLSGHSAGAGARREMRAGVREPIATWQVYNQSCAGNKPPRPQ